MTGPHDDALAIDDVRLTSQLIMCTGDLSSLHVLERALLASGTETTTVALCRYTPEQGDSLFEMLTARHPGAA